MEYTRFGWIVGGVLWISLLSLMIQGPISAQQGGRRSTKPGEVITRPDFGERWADQIKVGAPAPEFTLPLLNKDQDKKTETVSLKELREKRPVVLIFGSITCPPFRGQLTGVDAVFEKYSDRAEFLFIYIREAHPDSILSVVGTDGEESLVKMPQPADFDTRLSSAGFCQRTAQLKLPVAVDKIDNSVGKAYAGWPNRMLVVGTDGRVIFASEPGPRGTNAERLSSWLHENLPASSN